jgi:hypothetical protein
MVGALAPEHQAETDVRSASENTVGSVRSGPAAPALDAADSDEAPPPSGTRWHLPDARAALHDVVDGLSDADVEELLVFFQTKAGAKPEGA